VAAIAGSVSAADDLEGLQEQQQKAAQQEQQQQQKTEQQEQQNAAQQQQQQQVISFWAPEPQAASPDLFVTSRAAALTEALEKAQH
jgi:hypothetical protein